MDRESALRLFFALWPDDATRAALAGLQRGLRGRATAKENLHLTMAFLGAQPAATLPVLRGILAELQRPDIALVIDELGYFARARIAWAGMREAPQALRDWQAELVSRLADGGILFDKKPGFTPHVTLARNAAPVEAGPVEPLAWMRPQLVLVRSETRPEGVRYAVIGSADTADDAGAAAD
ncbi:RNA 2',3'-cyclic phosphodiesterase [Noviherbaspirillum pedocola]|uniref:RNA 2',3'-cyclic phosphodiesterase n=1 Tax=Noviherbaspirillum pedocola TaxID=2801341 RepID=A0A934SMG4_9BURK|nr:RNA 2',3'-cyclic phosphodiesterase [Noviherbaspirillum pedocola]MBK4733276.1 RNA 2',3'-cyclic phosphodiesterase [Noviherbaspirillum pedocola]